MARYHMNKKEREIQDPNIMKNVLRRSRYAVIALCRDNEPYIVTMNYGYDERKSALYFHAALVGLKLEFLKHNSSVCGTVVEDRGYKMGRCSQAYRSVVFQGKMAVVEDLDEKKYGMGVLLKHLEQNPQIVRERLVKEEKVYHTLNILRLDILEMTGKESR